VARVLSVNVGGARPVGAGGALTGIDKRPVSGPVAVRAPAGAGSGVDGDTVWDARSHGGPDKAVYAYAREDLDRWEAELGRALPAGVFGENLTTTGIDVTGARVGERWRVGADLLLQVAQPRIPCRNFAAWLDEQGWMHRFKVAARPGAYLRVLAAGAAAPGDPIVVEGVPGHDVTLGLAFRALTLEPALLPRLVASADLPPGVEARARAREPGVP
jgi:MOSC domain-containing protein YiiM